MQPSTAMDKQQQPRQPPTAVDKQQQPRQPSTVVDKQQQPNQPSAVLYTQQQQQQQQQQQPQVLVAEQLTERAAKVLTAETQLAEINAASFGLFDGEGVVDCDKIIPRDNPVNPRESIQ